MFIGRGSDVRREGGCSKGRGSDVRREGELMFIENIHPCTLFLNISNVTSRYINYLLP